MMYTEQEPQAYAGIAPFLLFFQGAQASEARFEIIRLTSNPVELHNGHNRLWFSFLEWPSKHGVS